MEHACQLQISTSPSPIAVVQKAVRIFNWKAQKSKKRTTTQAQTEQQQQQQLLPASGQQSGAHTHSRRQKVTHRKFIVSCRQRGEERSNLGCSMSNWQSKQQQQQEKTKKLPAGRSHKAEGEVQRSQAAGGGRRRGDGAGEVEHQQR